jgi:peptide/nickel transport system permease protein
VVGLYGAGRSGKIVRQRPADFRTDRGTALEYGTTGFYCRHNFGSFAILLGLISAMNAGSVLDRSISISTLCVLSVPEFFLAALLVFFIAVKLHWLPALPTVGADQSFLGMLRSLALPILTLTFAVLSHMTRMTRNAIINVLSSPYVEMAILKGAPR